MLRVMKLLADLGGRDVKNRLGRRYVCVLSDIITILHIKLHNKIIFKRPKIYCYLARICTSYLEYMCTSYYELLKNFKRTSLLYESI